MADEQEWIETIQGFEFSARRVVRGLAIWQRKIGYEDAVLCTIISEAYLPAIRAAIEADRARPEGAVSETADYILGFNKGYEEALEHEGAVSVEIHTASAANKRGVAVREDGKPWGSRLTKGTLIPASTETRGSD